jgi:ATP-binding cassette, subfamily F, member 3
MSLVNASGLSLAFGPDVLFEDASFSLGPHDRVGLIGPNGTGKSTLLKILAGQIGPDTGTLTWSRGARAGYLPQDVATLPDGPLVETVLASVPGRAALQSRLAQTEAALASSCHQVEQLELSQELAELHEEVDHFDEHYGRHRAERILTGLGFRQEELERSTRTLSGGWRMRAALAGLLLQDPDLLLLDEPTNHLDVPTLEWFDAFLRGTHKALLLISHDRIFLDRQIDRVLSLELEGLRSYAGDYEDYKRQRAEEEQQLTAQARRVEARRAELQGFIDRFGAKATKAAQARSRKKMLERLEVVQEREQRATLRFRFADAPRSGREVLRFEGVRKTFGVKLVYRDLAAVVQRGERVAIIGPNGAGKTTLLKLAAGELAPDAGLVKLGHSVVAGYYAQHHFEKSSEMEPQEEEQTPAGHSRPLALDPERTVLDTLWDLVPDQGEAYVRGVAGSFLFSGEDVDKKIGVLSGGERARVALAKLLLVPANLLLMDEPTNHLDLDSSEALIQALQGYTGTLLFVSHNQSFVNQLATQVWEVKEGSVLAFPGNLDDWFYHQRQLQEAASASGGAAGPSPQTTGRAEEKERRRTEAEERNARYLREKPFREEIARLETRIAELEQQEKEASRQLADPELYQDFARARPFLDAHREAKAKLEELYARWEYQQERLQEAAKLGE